MAPASKPKPLHSRNSRFARLIPAVILLAFSVALLYRLVLGGQALYWGDVSLYFYPMESFVQRQLSGGTIPLWNPYVLCGQPLHGNPQAWVFYPSTLLLWFVPVWLYFTLNTLLHLLLAGGGTYLLLRRMTHDRLAAILGGTVFMGSGFMMARLQFPTMIMAAAWLPWMLVVVDRMIDKPSAGYASLLAGVTILEILAAHSQLAYLTFACAILYALAKLWQIRRHRERAIRSLVGMTGALMVGIVGSMVYLLPTLQLFTLSTREKLTWMQANRFVLLPEQLINFVIPTFSGHPAHADYWGEGNFWEPCVYLGIAPLVLAIFAAIRGATRPAARFFAVVGFASLWLALGRFGGIYWLAFYLVPGMKSFHDPARFAFLTTFAFAALASFGLRTLRSRGVAESTRRWLVVISAVNLWAFTAHINPTIQPDAMIYRPRIMSAVPAPGRGRVFTAFRETVWKRYLNYSDYGPESARYEHELTDTVAPNIGMRFMIEEGSGYEPVPLKRTTEVDGIVRIALERKSSNLPSLLRLFNAEVLLLPEATRYRHAELASIEARGVAAMRLANASPRSWMVRRTRRIDGSQRALSVLGSPDFESLAEAVVSDSPGLGELIDKRSLLPVSAVTVLESSPHRFVANADAGRQRAFLVWSESWYPGWRAKIDGNSARIERTNHAFQGLAIMPGMHRVEFVYRPDSFRVGLFLSLAALTFITSGMTIGVLDRAARRRLRHEERGNEAASGVN